VTEPGKVELKGQTASKIERLALLLCVSSGGMVQSEATDSPRLRCELHPNERRVRANREPIPILKLLLSVAGARSCQNDRQWSLQCNLMF